MRRQEVLCTFTYVALEKYVQYVGSFVGGLPAIPRKTSPPPSWQKMVMGALCSSDHPCDGGTKLL
jgi:hypothetical protein